jgi:CubicO group peptidase (beta-lactamase class C family)
MTSQPPTARELGIMQGFPIPADRLVTPDNWQEGPWNRWSYQRVSMVLRTAQIARGGRVRRLAQRQRDLSMVSFADASGRATTVGEMLATTWTDGCVVLHDGAIVFERYFNGMSEATPHLFQSVSKSVTGALAGILVHDGRLDPDRLIGDYLPELRESGFGDATVRHALDMLVSVVYREDYDDPQSELQQHDRAAGWRSLLPGDVEGVYQLARTIRRDAEHGHVFQYCSLTTDVLGWVLARATGLPFAELLSREIWSQIGAEHDALITVDRFGSPATNGGICTTLRDLARFGQVILQDGWYNGRQIVPPAWIDDTRFAGDVETFARGANTARYPGGAYRNQWWVMNDDHGTFFGSGIYGQHLWLDPAARVVIAKFSSRPAALDLELGDLTLRGFAAIARSVKAGTE